MSDLTLNDYATGFDLAAQRVASIAEQVAELVAAGNIDSASLSLGTQQGKLVELQDCWGDLLDRLVRAGADWKRPLGRGNE